MKRRRTNSTATFVRTDRKRPIDKNLFSIHANNVGPTQIDTVLYTATFPGTLTGLRWNVGFANGAAVTDKLGWVIVVVPEGDSINAIGVTNGTNIYTPEKQVLAFGSMQAGSVGTDHVVNIEGSTKTMRKLMAGDKLYFSNKSTTGHADSVCSASVQFFYKT